MTLLLLNVPLMNLLRHCFGFLSCSFALDHIHFCGEPVGLIAFNLHVAPSPYGSYLHRSCISLLLPAPRSFDIRSAAALC